MKFIIYSQKQKSGYTQLRFHHSIICLQSNKHCFCACKDKRTVTQGAIREGAEAIRNYSDPTLSM